MTTNVFDQHIDIQKGMFMHISQRGKGEDIILVIIHHMEISKPRPEMEMKKLFSSQLTQNSQILQMNKPFKLPKKKTTYKSRNSPPTPQKNHLQGTMSTFVHQFKEEKCIHYILLNERDISWYQQCQKKTVSDLTLATA